MNDRNPSPSLAALGADIMMGEYVAATGVNEEIGEAVQDIGAASRIVLRHARQQWTIGSRLFADLLVARSVDAWFAASLHGFRASIDNQFALATEIARLQADGLARTRYTVAVGLASLERAVVGRPKVH